MKNELIAKHDVVMLNNIKEHKKMLSIISKNLPAINKGTRLFCKTQSQFMDNTLTLHHPSPIRNLRQVLAEIDKAMQGLKESYFDNRKKEVKIKKLRYELGTQKLNEFDKELKNIEIEELCSQIDFSKKYISGAIRKVTNYIIQYNNILKAIGVKEFDEIDFEKEEECYHIMTAFSQALNAARSHGGVIDEGNHIYLSQIGINGTTAQRELSLYLATEGKMISEGKEPTHEMQIAWLNKMYNKFKGSASKYCENKGIKLKTDNALIGRDNK